MVRDAALFPKFCSVIPPEMSAVFAKLPAEPNVTVKVTIREAPSASVPKLQLIFPKPAGEHEASDAVIEAAGPLAEAERKSSCTPGALWHTAHGSFLEVTT